MFIGLFLLLHFQELALKGDDPEHLRRRRCLSMQSYGWVYVDLTPVGSGVFAARDFEEEEEIGSIEGPLIHGDQCDPEYCIEVSEDSVLEPQPPFRFLNHSCEPNSEIRDNEWPKESPLVLVSLRSVEAGEELTIDYRWPADDAIACQCGSLRCRGWVVAEEELPNLPPEKTAL